MHTGTCVHPYLTTFDTGAAPRVRMLPSNKPSSFAHVFIQQAPTKPPVSAPDALRVFALEVADAFTNTTPRYATADSQGARR